MSAGRTGKMPMFRRATARLPDIRALYRSCGAANNAPAADRLAAEARLATYRSFLRLRAIVRCVFLRRDGFARLELLPAVLAGPVPDQREPFPQSLLVMSSA